MSELLLREDGRSDDTKTSINMQLQKQLFRIANPKFFDNLRPMHQENGQQERETLMNFVDLHKSIQDKHIKEIATYSSDEDVSLKKLVYSAKLDDLIGGYLDYIDSMTNGLLNDASVRASLNAAGSDESEVDVDRLLNEINTSYKGAYHGKMENEALRNFID
jgi:hypothetical protein